MSSRSVIPLVSSDTGRSVETFINIILYPDILESKKGKIMQKNQTILPYLLFAMFFLFTLPLQAADYTNSIGMEFNNVPSGSFYMGSCKINKDDISNVKKINAVIKKENDKRKFLGLPAKPLVKPKEANCPSGGNPDKKARAVETPQHKVQITKSFQMGIYEVTVGQFKRFITEAKRFDLLGEPGSVGFMWANNFGDNKPICYISWEDAQAFIDWLNNKENGNYYRLPTEAEWEYVARAGTTTVFPWGNSYRPELAGKYAWHYKDNDLYAKALDVGSKLPNPWGFYDMYGNVGEWVQDWYVSNYYKDSPINDPQGPTLEQIKKTKKRVRVIRGGSYKDTTVGIAPARRYYLSPEGRSVSIGFRVVRIPHQGKNDKHAEKAPVSGLSVPPTHNKKMDIEQNQSNNENIIYNTHVILNLNGKPFSGSLSDFHPVGEKILFKTGNKLWVSDGTSKGTKILKDSDGKKIGFDTGFRGAGAQILNDKLVFIGEQNDTGDELWVSDTTESGTYILKDIVPGKSDSNLDNFELINGKVVFQGEPDFYKDRRAHCILYSYAGTRKNLVELFDTSSGGYYSLLGRTQNKLYYYHYNGGKNSILSTDGTKNGTAIVYETTETNGFGNVSKNSKHFAVTKSGALFFVAQHKVYNQNSDEWVNKGYALWVRDESSFKTRFVKDLTKYLDNFPGNFQPVGDNQIIFIHSDGFLWISDGTTKGTKKLLNHTGEEFYHMRKSQIKSVGYRCYFTYYQKKTGKELWVTDGTQKGTHILKDMDTGEHGFHPERSSNPVLLESVNGRLLFATECKYNYKDRIKHCKLFSTTGTGDSIEEIFDSSNGYYKYLGKRNGKLYLSVQEPDKHLKEICDETIRYMLVSTDGTRKGSTIIAETKSTGIGKLSNDNYHFAVTNKGRIYFMAHYIKCDGNYGELNTTSNMVLWVSEITTSKKITPNISIQQKKDVTEEHTTQIITKDKIQKAGKNCLTGKDTRQPKLENKNGNRDSLLQTIIRNSMDKSDQEVLSQVLEFNRINTSTSWHNPNTRNHYTVMPTRTYQSSNGPCREYSIEADIQGKIIRVYDTACRQ